MNCNMHNEKEAVGACVACGKLICEECKTEISGKYYCKKCVSEIMEEKDKKIKTLENNDTNLDLRKSATPLDINNQSNDKLIVGLLAIFLGGFGIHKFYLDRVLEGVIYLLFSWTCIPAVIGLVEGIIYLTMDDSEFHKKFRENQ